MGRVLVLWCKFTVSCWLTQQPVTLPQQPCWNLWGLLHTAAWLISRVSESHSWCDGSVAKHKPFRHLLLPSCHLFLDWTLISRVVLYLTYGKLSSKQQTSRNDCLQRSRPVVLVNRTARDQISSLRWTSCVWGHEKTENCRGLWEQLKGMEEP